MYFTNGLRRGSCGLAITWCPNPAGQFLDVCNPAGEFLDGFSRRKKKFPSPKIFFNKTKNHFLIFAQIHLKLRKNLFWVYLFILPSLLLSSYLFIITPHFFLRNSIVLKLPRRVRSFKKLPCRVGDVKKLPRSIRIVKTLSRRIRASS